MEKLISMVNFVLEFSNTHKATKIEFHSMARKYANFLKQPLTLGMFVPCDLDGNVLEKHCGEIKKGCRDCACREYEKAIDRVLFEGVELKDKYNRKEQYINDWIVLNGELYFDNQDKAPSKVDLTIEYLVKYNLQLTEIAQKQIGL